MTRPYEPRTRYEEQPPPDLTYAEYLLAVAAVQAALAAVVAAVAVPYQALQLTRSDWLSFLSIIYPIVYSARLDIAELAREFHDSERGRHVKPIRVPALDELVGPDGRPIRLDDTTGLTRTVYERLDINLAHYEPDWFEDAMDAVVLEFSRPNVTDRGVAKVIGAVLKETERGGHDTALWAVEDDPRVVGWARVEGNENVGSCGFCAMLISRGPVYKDTPANAGLEVGSEAMAVEIFRQAEATGDDAELMALMNRWHPNCDCKVVPVFNRANWPGRAQYMSYERLWASVTKGYSGLDALNAFRRAIERGETGEGLPARLRPAA